MLTVYFDSHAGFRLSFQMPWRLAGWPGVREQEISRYRAYWKYRAASCGSPPAANKATRSFVGSSTRSDVPRSSETRANSSRWSSTCRRRNASNGRAAAGSRCRRARRAGSAPTSVQER
jgi:hypothetical protein